MLNLHQCLQVTVLCGSGRVPAPPPASESIGDFLARIGYSSLDYVNEVGTNPLHWAVFLGHPDLVRRIVSAKPELVATKDKVGFSTLMFGALRPDEQLCAILREVPEFCRSEVLDACTKKGLTCLHRAAKGGFASNMEALLQAKAQVDPVRRDNGYTPLLCAAEAGYVDCCRLLLKHRAGQRLGEKFLGPRRTGAREPLVSGRQLGAGRQGNGDLAPAGPA